MLKKLRFALSLLTAVIILASCGKKAPKEAKYIPKDAAYTVVVDSKSLQDKMKAGGVGIDSLIKKIERLSGDTMSAKDKQVWEDFKTSGIDQEGNITFFILQKGSIKDGQTFVINAMSQVKDQAKLEAFFKKQEAFKNKPVTKEGNYSYIRMETNSMISFNEDVAIATFYQKEYKPQYDTLGNYVPADRSGDEAAMKKQVAAYYTQKESESLAAVDYFKDMFKEKADGYMFTSSAGSVAMLKGTPFFLPKLEDLLKDNYGVATFNFEEGKIVMKGTSYYNAQMAALVKKYPGASINMSAIENFPSQNVNGFLLLSFNPELLDGILKELEVGGLIDGFLAPQGITRADLFKALKGEFNLAVGDFSITKKPRVITMPDGSTYPTTSEEPDAKLVFSAAIGDKAAFSKLMNKAVETGAVVKTANGYAAGQMLQSVGFFLHTDDKYLVLAKDSATYAAYIAGKTKAKVDADVLAKAKGKSMAFYANVNSIVNGVAASENSPLSAKIASIVNGTFKDVLFTCDSFEGKSIKSDGEVRMTDAKKNSLVSIINMGLNIGSAFKDEYSKSKASMMAPGMSEMPPPPPPAQK